MCCEGKRPGGALRAAPEPAPILAQQRTARQGFCSLIDHRICVLAKMDNCPISPDKAPPNALSGCRPQGEQNEKGYPQSTREHGNQGRVTVALGGPPRRRVMVDSVTISNFRSFREATIEDLRRVNVLVGENGSGKTALLEAIFLAGGVSPEIAMRTRSWRGAETSLAFQGTQEDLYEALWGDLFHKFQSSRGAVVRLRGRSEENRSVTVTLNKQGQRKVVPPSRTRPGAPPKVVPEPSLASFKWRVQGYPDIEIKPRLVDGRLLFDDAPVSYVRASFFAANRSPPLVETVQRYSNLSQKFESSFFNDAFKKLYPQLDDMSIELNVGAGMLYCKLPGIPQKLSLGAVSGGMNRLSSYLLGIANQENGIVIIDELENGLYHGKLPSIWRTLFDFRSEEHTSE